MTVATRERLTPNLVEVTLAGDALADFPTGFEGGYIKLVFPQEGGRPVARSYTIRDFDPETRAGEFGASRALRQYFRHERRVDRDDMYVSCYWKIGATDEGMKQAKRDDSEPW